jgi:hypothetical protein
VIRIQVGHFFECYGPLAVELSEKLNMTLAMRRGIPKVGFLATHTRRWLEKALAGGHSVGLDYQERSGDYRLERSLVFRSATLSPWDALPDESFLETGKLDGLGIRGEGPLEANEVFQLITDVSEGLWQRLCTDQKCLHDSKFVKCIIEESRMRELLGKTASQGLVIYPQAW